MSWHGQAKQPIMQRGRSVSAGVPDAPGPSPWISQASRSGLRCRVQTVRTTGKKKYWALSRKRLGVSATAQADGGARPEMGTSAGSGALPREIFFHDLGDFQAKSAYHTTYRTSLESSH